jgi:hypothetical protein
LENHIHIYKWKSGTVIHRYWKAEHHIKGSVSIGIVKVTMVSRVLRVQCSFDHSMMFGVGRMMSRFKVQGLIEAGMSETKKARRSDSDDDKCQVESGLGRRPILETGGWNDMVMTVVINPC